MSRPDSNYLSGSEKIRPLVLCGGSGTRLWPLSSETLPKQLLPLHGSSTLLQAAAQRITGELFDRPVIVSRAEYGPAVASQLAHVGVEPEILLLEPAARNTAAAVALGVFYELAAHRDPFLLVLPSDHVILDNRAFVAAVETGLAAADTGAIVTFGVSPTRPETGFGYIEAEPNDNSTHPLKVARFTEKPDRETAQHYLASGRHYWNSGMLLFRASSMKEHLLLHAPQVAAACEEALSASVLDGYFLHVGRQAFCTGPSISIDYAVLEKSGSVFVVPADMGWSDIGNWRALWELSDKDANGNAVSGEVEILNCKNCLIRNETDSKAAIAHADGLVVIMTAAGTLVIPQEFAQDAGFVSAKKAVLTNRLNESR